VVVEMILIILGELYLLFFSRGDEENIGRHKKKRGVEEE
jgi:hypothetical protein